jgi:hypothetical protein
MARTCLLLTDSYGWSVVLFGDLAGLRRCVCCSGAWWVCAALMVHAPPIPACEPVRA